MENHNYYLVMGGESVKLKMINGNRRRVDTETEKWRAELEDWRKRGKRRKAKKERDSERKQLG